MSTMFWLVMPLEEEDKKRIKDNIDDIWKLSYIINQLYDKNVIEIGVKINDDFCFNDEFSENIIGHYINDKMFVIDEYDRKYTLNEFLKEIIN